MAAPMTRSRSAVVALFGIAWASAATAGQVPTDPGEMFDAFCALCHGEDGRGQVENPAIDSEPMDFTDCAVATPEPDGDWELVITHGGLAAGLSSEMPSYATHDWIADHARDLLRPAEQAWLTPHRIATSMDPTGS